MFRLYLTLLSLLFASGCDILPNEESKGSSKPAKDSALENSKPKESNDKMQAMVGEECENYPKGSSQFKRDFAKATLSGNAGLEGELCADIRMGTDSVHVYLGSMNSDTALTFILPKDLVVDHTTEVRTRVSEIYGFDFFQGWIGPEKDRKYANGADRLAETIDVSGVAQIETLEFPEDRRDDSEYFDDPKAPVRRYHFRLTVTVKADNGEEFKVAGDVIFPNPDFDISTGKDGEDSKAPESTPRKAVSSCLTDIACFQCFFLQLVRRCSANIARIVPPKREA